jgi:tetratricopeptide (TPR) repeat protein
MLRTILFGLSLCLLQLPAAHAATVDDELVRPLQDRWAEIKYRVPEKQQAEQYAQLAQDAHRVSEANPNAAAALVWEGIIVSSAAGARGGLGALTLAKQARDLLEESLKLDERAMNGSAYTSLGTLYAKVPRRPIGFGDRERAEKLFKKSLEINPDGIDPNFFYGEYLVERGRYTEGRQYLEKALAAPPRPGRELADEGRRQEAQALLKKITKKT